MKPSSRGFSWRCPIAAALVCAGLLGCGNPAVDARVDALGGEVNGVQPSQYHRPGQPCTLCHSTYEGASPQISVGGTVFAAPTEGNQKPIPVKGVKVTVYDSFGASRTVETNCIGNFFITKDQWDPGFPLGVSIECPGPGGTHAMSTRISRQGSCAGCHTGAANQGSVGWVYCSNTAAGYQPPTHADCPGVP